MYEPRAQARRPRRASPRGRSARAEGSSMCTPTEPPARAGGSSFPAPSEPTTEVVRSRSVRTSQHGTATRGAWNHTPPRFALVAGPPDFRRGSDKAYGRMSHAIRAPGASTASQASTTNGTLRSPLIVAHISAIRRRVQSPLFGLLSLGERKCSHKVRTR